MSQTTQLQTILKGMGLYAGPIDGQMTAETSHAIARFQHQHDLARTGVYDFATQGTLSGIMGGIAGKSPLPPDVMALAQKNYGPALMAYINHPELGPIIIKAALGTDGKGGGSLSAQELRAQLQNTDYWRNTQQSARQFDTLLATDPGEAQRTISRTRAQVQDAALRMGINLPVEEIDKVAYTAARLSWDTNTLNDQLVAHAQFKPGVTPGGDLGATVTEIKRRAAQYMVNLSDSTAFSMAQRVIKGEISMSTTGAQGSGVDQNFVAQAKARMPWLSEQIDNGVTPADYFEPYKQQIASTLELSPDAVDFVTDPTWQKVVDYIDPKTQQHRAMTISEAQTFARQQPQYGNTADARRKAAGMGMFLAQKMGMVS